MVSISLAKSQGFVNTWPVLDGMCIYFELHKSLSPFVLIYLCKSAQAEVLDACLIILGCYGVIVFCVEASGVTREYQGGKEGDSLPGE